MYFWLQSQRSSTGCPLNAVFFRCLVFPELTTGSCAHLVFSHCFHTENKNDILGYMFKEKKERKIKEKENIYILAPETFQEFSVSRKGSFLYRYPYCAMYPATLSQLSLLHEGNCALQWQLASDRAAGLVSHAVWWSHLGTGLMQLNSCRGMCKPKLLHSCSSMRHSQAQMWGAFFRGMRALCKLQLSFWTQMAMTFGFFVDQVGLC